MFKKLLMLLLVIAFVAASIPVMAAETPVVYTGTITVTEDGGRFQVGFANLEFKKQFLDEDKLPVTFEVRISVVEGKAGISIIPSTPDFCKKVHIRIDAYKGILYDDTNDKNIKVDIKKQQMILEHFSRYAFS